MTTPPADIGLIGLAVMGQNLVLNMNDHGFVVAVYNRTVSKVDEFLGHEAKGTQVVGAHSIEELAGLLKRPRRVMLMVKAGSAVDDFIELLIPHLEPGDIIIDGGNSNYEDFDPPYQLSRVQRASSSLARASRVARRARAMVRRSCQVALQRLGLPSGLSFKRSPLRCLKATPTVRPAVIGSAKTGPAISSRWCTTASSTAISRSSPRPTSSCRRPWA